MHFINSRHSPTLAIWFGYLFFVLYGSLVPLEFEPRPLEQAWAIFQQTTMYDLGVESRADWISNGVLYVPVGFLSTHLLLQTFSDARRVPLFFLAGSFSIAFALGIEFTQIFFPARTVSLNDLFAEGLGSLAGVVLAAKYSEWFKALIQALFSNPARLAFRLMQSYLVGYIAFCLFPYDLLISASELEQKVRGSAWGWLLAGDQQELGLTTLKLLFEIVLTLPFGLFLGYRSARLSAPYPVAVILGTLLGGFIELAQFFCASGVSQGLSVLTRTAGVCGGLALWQHRANWSPQKLALRAQRYALPLGVIYLTLLLYVNGFFSQRWNDTGLAASHLADLHFLPFYYHYYTTEAKALFSLASVFFMYIPIGILVWSIGGAPFHAFFYATSAASLVETGKLFLLDKHPDPTNIVLAALAAGITVHLARTLGKAVTLPATAVISTEKVQQVSPSQALDPSLPATKKTQKSWTSYAVLYSSLAFAAYWAATFPSQPRLLFIFLSTCAAIIWYRPALLIVIIVTALPVLDLAPWSGRFFLDEFDLLVLISLAIGYARIPAPPRNRKSGDVLFALVSGLLALSFAIGTVRGLMPWPPPDANAFTNYYSPFNALRVGKGALWAFLSYGLLRRMAWSGIDVQRPLTWGLAIGLSLTVAVVIWERLTVNGLIDFVGDYRITGPFSSMHTGGAYIECFLAVATPFLIVLILRSRNWLGGLLGSVLLVATTYALMVTFSRNGYLAFAVALSIVLFFATFKSERGRQRFIFAMVLTATMLAVALPILGGQFAQRRIATLERDYTARLASWEQALDIRTKDLLTASFGMGLGRYPESHYLLSGEENRSATYQFKSEGKNTFLRLGPGKPIYMEQIVPIEPSQNYILKLDVRSQDADARLSVSLCEKWMLTSFSCVRRPINAGNEAGLWKHVEIPFDSTPLLKSPWYIRKPVKLSFHHRSGKLNIDIGNVLLVNALGENILINGNFSSELDHWYFSEDAHLPWRTHNLSVAVLFDQGWFGLIALALFSILAIKRGTVHAWRGDLNAAAALASFCAFLVVGLFDTLVDAPRFLFLLLLLGWFLCFKGFSSVNLRKTSNE